MPRSILNMSPTAKTSDVTTQENEPKKLIPQLSSKSVEWYTPKPIVDRARLLMGEIDLDPASCLVANETVRARQIYDVANDGLTKPWRGRVFLNPPGGKVDGESSMRLWWQNLAIGYESGNVFQGFFVAFTLEILRSSQQGIPVQRYFRCYPSARIKFIGAGDSPTHANVLVYLPERTSSGKPDPNSFDRFRNIFGDIGLCETGSNA